MRGAAGLEEHNKAPGYMTYREAAIMFSLMPDTDAAAAIKATVGYYLYGVLPDEISGVAANVCQRPWGCSSRKADAKV